MRKFLLAGVVILGLTSAGAAHADALDRKLDELRYELDNKVDELRYEAEDQALALRLHLEDMQREQQIRDSLRDDEGAAHPRRATIRCAAGCGLAPKDLPHTTVPDCNGGTISLPVGWTVDCH
jgi:hypothetical protein